MLCLPCVLHAVGGQTWHDYHLQGMMDSAAGFWLVFQAKDNSSIFVHSLCTLHQENPKFTFHYFFVLFHTFFKKCRKSMKKPSPLLF